MAVIALSGGSTTNPSCPTLPAAAVAITPADADTFSRPVHVYVGNAGNVVCTPAAGGADVTVVAQSGTVVPFRVTAVKATGTTATGLLAVY